MMLHPIFPVQITRRSALVSMLRTGVVLLGGGALSACGDTASGTSAAVTSAARPSATTVSSIPLATTHSPASMRATTAVTSSTAVSPAPAAGTAPASGKRGGVTWLVRTNTVENQWENAVAIPAFQKVQPAIAVTPLAVAAADFDTKLLSLFSAGTPADIWSHWGVSGFADFAHQGVVGDLTALVSRDHYDLTAFDQPLVAAYRRDGKQLAIPITTGGLSLYFDRDLLQRASIDPPSVDWAKAWSWDQFVSAAQKLTRDYGAPTGVYGVTYTQNIQQLAYLGGGDAFLPESYQTGLAKTTQLDAPEVLAGVQAAYDLLYKDRVNPTPDLNKGLTAGSVDPFVAQRVAMNVANFGPLQTYVKITAFKWSLAADPILKSNRSVYYTDPWMLSSRSADVESAWTFMQYLLGVEGLTAYIAATGRRPARTAVVAQWLDQWTGPMGLTKAELQAFSDGMVTNGRESANHLLVGYPQITQAINQALAGVWSGKTSPHDGLAQAKQQVDAVLAAIH
jgi:multiple sugar transport system substrate-binding protein